MSIIVDKEIDMTRKVILPILFISVIFMFFLGLNELNSRITKRNLIEEQTPVKFSLIINKFEKENFENLEIMTENLTSNIYRQYKIKSQTYGFMVGTMGYEEEILVYMELEYINELISVNQVKVLYENETDGYGDYVVEPWFLDRFKQIIKGNFSLVKRKKTNENQIIAITGATITSEAIVKAVNDCRQIMEESKNEKE